MARLLRPALLPGLLAAVTLAAASGPVAPAAMHLRLTRSVPVKDTTLALAPAEISLWFSQRPQLPLSAITLTGPEGAVVRLSAVTLAPADSAPLVAKVEGTMAPGRYTIAWRTASSDGHAIRGTILFTVRAAE